MSTESSRTEQLKQSLISWRQLLLPMNNLLQWKHQYDPLIIFLAITSIFAILSMLDPPLVTLVSSLLMIVILVDLSAPFIIQLLFKEQNWNEEKEMNYTNLCERIAHLERHINHQCQSISKMREERPDMYFILGFILLIFLAICGQRFNNAFLLYLIVLILCLIPGVRRRYFHSHSVVNEIEKNKTQ